MKTLVYVWCVSLVMVWSTLAHAQKEKEPDDTPIEK